MYELKAISESVANQFNHSQRKSMSKIISLSFGESLDQDLILSQKGLLISGQIYFNSKIFEGTAYVSIISEPGQEYVFVSLNINGRKKGVFSFKDIPPGKYIIAVASGQGSKNMSERFKVEVLKNSKNHFRIDTFKDKVEGGLVSFDGSLLYGQAYFFKSHTLSKKFNPLYFESKVFYRSVVFDSKFNIKFPKDQKFDLYFIFNNRRIPSYYITNYVIPEDVRSPITFNLPEIITREFNVFTIDGEPTREFDMLIVDDKGVAVVSHNKSKSINFDFDKKLLFLYKNQNYRMYISSHNQAVITKYVSKDSTEPINITFKRNLELGIEIQAAGNYYIELYDGKKNKIIRPMSGEEYNEFKHNSKPSHLIYNKGMQIKVTSGEYYLKIINSATAESRWSNLIIVLHQDVNVSL
ncbi:MAG: hypothetical protein COA79_11660 [Planctomycetota bacterium]|nr:MAG: hypothetical protein COA79_11660 [Planctomycetota bacterium]